MSQTVFIQGIPDGCFAVSDRAGRVWRYAAARDAARAAREIRRAAPWPHEPSGVIDTAALCEEFLPVCLRCGAKAARCPCPTRDADGRALVGPVPTFPPPDPRTVEGARAYLARRPAPPEPGPFRSRPWCPEHGWNMTGACCRAAKAGYP